MILGAGQLQMPIIQRAKERGLRVIVVSPGTSDPGFMFADKIVHLDVRDKYGILEAARKFKIDGITTDQTDLPVRTVAYVAQEMGLPGIPYEIGCLFTDKYKMRKRCTELGIPTPRYALVYSIDETIEFYKKCQYNNMIIKPVDSQASHGVSKIISENKVQEYFQEAASYSRSGGVLIEEWIDGEEFSVDSYIDNGKCHVLAIGHYHPFSIPGTFASYETIFPADKPQEVIDLIEDTNRQIIEGFGLTQGRSHGEYIVSNNQCYLVEIGARGGGAYFSSDNVRYVSGFQSEDYLIDLALGKKNAVFNVSNERYGCCCTLFVYLPEGGKVETLTGIDEVKALDFVKRNNLEKIQLNQINAKIIDKATRYFMVVVAENYSELHDYVNHIRNVLLIQTRMPNGEISLPIWK